MKRIIKVVSILFVVMILAGCSKKYNAITYTKFSEIFKNKSNFNIINQ